MVRKGRKKKERPNKKQRFLKGAPHVRATVIKTHVLEPRKPNSAKRKVARARLITGREVTAFIPGEGHQIREHDQVLVCPGGAKDLGVHWQIVRGPREVAGPEGLRTKRSKFGVKRPK